MDTSSPSNSSVDKSLEVAKSYAAGELHRINEIPYVHEQTKTALNLFVNTALEAQDENMEHGTRIINAAQEIHKLTAVNYRSRRRAIKVGVSIVRRSLNHAKRSIITSDTESV